MNLKACCHDYVVCVILLLILMISDMVRCIYSSFLFNVGGSLQWSSFSPFRLITLGFVVIYVFALSFGPFIYLVSLPQIVNRKGRGI